MYEGHLSIEEFLSRLSRLFDNRRTANHGSLHLTQKRLTPPNTAVVASPSSIAPFPDLHPDQPLPVLIRASNGKSKDNKKDKIKLSTVVQPNELENFFVRYAEVCKAGMSGLKKRDRSGRKAKVKKKKLRKGVKDVKVEEKERKT